MVGWLQSLVMSGWVDSRTGKLLYKNRVLHSPSGRKILHQTFYHPGHHPMVLSETACTLKLETFKN